MENSVICTLCTETFSSRNKLFTHIAKVHDDSKAREEANKKPCIGNLSSWIDNRSLEDQIVVIDEDEYYRIIEKPQGMATMGGKGASKGITLMNSDKMLLPNAIKDMLEYKKALPCHRLDKDTGGLVVCSKSKDAEKAINICFRHKYIYKKYTAIVAGKLDPPNRYITTPLWSKLSITRYQVLEYTDSLKYGTVSTVALFPITGRRHQLRRHLQGIGHSIIGDKRYSHSLSWPDHFSQLFLFAVGVEMPHPVDVERVVQLASEKKTRGQGREEEELGLDDSDNEGEGDEETAPTNNNNSAKNTLSSPTTNNTELVICDGRKYDNIGYGCVRADYVTHGIKMINVEIPEPPFYRAFREYNKQQYEDSVLRNAREMTGGVKETK